MKPAGYLLLVPAGCTLFGADDSPRSISREMTAHIREGLPIYQAPPAAPKASSEQSPVVLNPTDPGLLVLPNLTVEEKRLPLELSDHLMHRQDRMRKLANLYLDRLAASGALDAALNGFTIPILSPSLAARGAALERGEELERLADLLSPEEAKSLNDLYDGLAGVLGRRAPGRR